MESFLLSWSQAACAKPGAPPLLSWELPNKPTDSCIRIHEVSIINTSRRTLARVYRATAVKSTRMYSVKSFEKRYVLLDRSGATVSSLSTIHGTDFQELVVSSVYEIRNKHLSFFVIRGDRTLSLSLSVISSRATFVAASSPAFHLVHTAVAAAGVANIAAPLAIVPARPQMLTGDAIVSYTESTSDE